MRGSSWGEENILFRDTQGAWHRNTVGHACRGVFLGIGLMITLIFPSAEERCAVLVRGYGRKKRSRGPHAG
jgi:hypothetical protein